MKHLHWGHAAVSPARTLHHYFRDTEIKKIFSRVPCALTAAFPLRLWEAFAPQVSGWGIFLIAALAGAIFLLVRSGSVLRGTRTDNARFRRRYDLLAENIDTGIVIIKNGLVVYASRRMLTLAGHAREDIVGKPFSCLVSRDGTPAARCAYATAGTVAGATFLSTRSRGVIPVEVRSLPLEQEDGACLCIVQETAERQRIEKERARFSVFVEKNPYPVVEVTTGGCVLYANEAALALFPLMPQEGIACSFLAGLARFADRAAAGEADHISREIPAGGRWYLQQMCYSKKTASVRIYSFDITDRKRAEESLVRSEEKYRLLFETVDQGIMYHAADGKVLAANPAAERILGVKLGAMIYKDCDSVFAGALTENGSALDPGAHPALTALARGREIDDRVLGITHASTGACRWLSMSAVPQFRPGESLPCQAYTVFRDVTEQRRAAQELQDSEARYRAFFEYSRDGILIADWKSGQIIDVNPCLGALAGCEPVELKGKTLWNVPAFRCIVPDRAAFIELQLREYTRCDHAALLTKEGGSVDVEYLASACGPLSHRVLQCSVRDISDRTRAEGQVRYLSFHDKVTGLYNRTYCEEELRRIDQERWLPISFVMGDVNNLKLVNDAFGHREGDRLLVRIAGILRGCCRAGDVIARWGGDEFIMLLPRTDEKTAMEIARRVREECARTKGRAVGTSIALGMATKERVGQDAYELLREAEDRMYRSKLIESRSGRNAMIATLIKAMRKKSHETLQHTLRVRRLSVELGRAAGLSDSHLDELALLAALHDIGTIAVPDEVLMKAGMLTPKEWKDILKHPEVGYRIVRSFSPLARIADAVLAHHERWDGSGYPQGLKGNEIPLIARIFAVADAYDVMTRGRSYEPAIPPARAVRELKKHAGRQFDPELVEIFLEKVEPLRLAVAQPVERGHPALV